MLRAPLSSAPERMIQAGNIRIGVNTAWTRRISHQSRSYWAGAFRAREFIELSEGHIVTQYLPPYALELNPVEYIWAYWKQHELPNVCPKDYGHLNWRARHALRRMQRKPRLLTAFWKQSSLCFD